MDFITLSAATVNNPPQPSPKPQSPSRKPTSTSTSAPSSPRPSICPFASLVPSSRTATLRPSSEAPTRSICPFSSLVPAAQSASPPPTTSIDNPPAPEDPAAQAGPELVVVRRRCPWWVRILRFSAKYIAKQVVIRSVKSGVVKVFHELRK